MAQKLALLACRILLSGVFAWAAFSKIGTPENTHMAVYQYQIASWETSALIAAYLPWIELLAAIALWIPRFRLGASIIIAGLTTLFIAAIVSAMLRELDITCGCFGAADAGAMLAPRLIEDFVLLVSSLFLLKEDALALDVQLQLSPTTDN